MNYHVLLVCNTLWNLYNFRRGLITQFLQQGYRVTVLAPPDRFADQLKNMGCNVAELVLDNKGINVFRETLAIRHFYLHYKKLKPDIILHYTVKPVIYGSLAARALKIPVVNTITGLGTAFLQEGWLNLLVKWLYRFSQRWPKHIFFQNRDDYQLFVDQKLVAKDKAECLPGSGIDLNYFSPAPYPERTQKTFLLIARLLWDKGIGEYVDAARQIRKKYPGTRFQLLGALGVANRSAIPASQVSAWEQEGVLNYLGEVDNVRPFIENADCIVLPSYREGAPRSLLEAAAMARPIITTDVPGCREVVVDGINGFLCKARDADDLSEVMQRFILLPADKQRDMGIAGRKLVEGKFNQSHVIERYQNVIDALLSTNT